MVTLTAVPVDDWGGSLTVAAVTSYHVLFEMVMRRQSILADAFIRSIIGFLRSVFNIFQHFQPNTWYDSHIFGGGDG